MLSIIIYLILSVILVCLLLKFYAWYSCGKCVCNTDMKWKTVVITGGNRGIGKEYARLLALKGAKVIIGCRNITSGEEAVKELTAGRNNNLKIMAKPLDLSSFESIKSFAKDIERNESSVSVLICNAAIIPAKSKHMTVDGLEEQFAVNHFGHFLLTSLLMSKLVQGSPSRIIVVSSVQHHLGHIDFENLNFEKSIVDPLKVYWNTKLANMLFVKELSRKLLGTKITVNGCHPGFVKTGINKELSYWKRLFQSLTYPLFAKSIAQGAQTVIHMALAPELKFISGKYFSDCRQTKPSQKCFDIELAKKLWEVSESLTRCKYVIPK